MEENISKLSDAEIIAILKKETSSKYFEVLYKRYYAKVLDKCYSFVKNRNLAEELAKDIFSKVYEKLGSFKGLSSFSSWLYSIAYNHCIEYLRKEKRLHYPNWNRENEMPDIIDETEENIEDINYDNLMAVMELIHPEEKALIFMKYKDDLSMKEIGAALRISEDAAKMRLKRARTRILYLYTEKYLRE